MFLCLQPRDTHMHSLTHIHTHAHTQHFSSSLTWDHLDFLQGLAPFFLSFLLYKLALMASGDQSARSPVNTVRTEVNATKKLEPVTVLLVTQEKTVPHVSH